MTDRQPTQPGLPKEGAETSDRKETETAIDLGPEYQLTLDGLVDDAPALAHMDEMARQMIAAAGAK